MKSDLKLRRALTKEDFSEKSGLTCDMPKFPATTLLDDINEVIVETTVLRLVPEYHTYKVYAYPPSHHMIK